MTGSSVQFSSVAQLCPTLRPHGLQCTRLPCPSPTPRACSNSCPSSWWCHPIISSSAIPFSSCLQSVPASGSFPMSQHFASDGQSIGTSALASVLPVNILNWFPLRWTGWISLQFRGALKSLLQHHSSKASILQLLVIFSHCLPLLRKLFSSVQFSSLSCVQLSATPWITAHQASLSITNSRSSLKLMSIKSVMPSSHLILCHPLLFLPPIPPSIKVFSNESILCMRWPKYWSFSFSISPSNEHQDWSLGWTGWISLQSRGSQESSPTPQFRSINSSVLHFLHSPTLTSILDHWKNHSLD